jgi:hypothetical protein
MPNITSRSRLPHRLPAAAVQDIWDAWVRPEYFIFLASGESERNSSPYRTAPHPGSGSGSMPETEPSRQSPPADRPHQPKQHIRRPRPPGLPRSPTALQSDRPRATDPTFDKQPVHHTDSRLCSLSLPPCLYQSPRRQTSHCGCTTTASSCLCHRRLHISHAPSPPPTPNWRPLISRQPKSPL